MTKPINKAVSIWAGIGLLLMFLVVQLLLRFAFAVAMSRFEPLPAGSRRASKPIKISNTGQIMNSDGSSFKIQNEDANLVFEMDKPFRKLEVDGFDFSVSRMKTFITQKPLGVVSSQNDHVFGSVGTSYANQMYFGTVALAPRKQWAIAITQGDLALLANGEQSVDARMIVFFDDISRTPLNDQVSELLERITTSSFASDLGESMESARSRSMEKPVLQTEKTVEPDQVTGKVETTETVVQEFYDPNDPLN
jgi:hypothetical protein